MSDVCMLMAISQIYVVYRKHLRIPNYMDDILKEISKDPDSDREYIKLLFECVFPKEKLMAKGVLGHTKKEIQSDIFSSLEYLTMNGEK